MSEGTFITVTDAAEILGLSRKVVTRLIKEGILHHHRRAIYVGGSWRLSKSEVIKLRDDYGLTPDSSSKGREWPLQKSVDYAAIIERDKSICHICGKFVPPAEMSLDHLIPVSRGGPDAAWNLRVAHKRCNSSRGPGRTPAQLLLIG